MTRPPATSVHYIKLGEGGEWEEEALRDGVLRFGYADMPHELCLAGDWEAGRPFYEVVRSNKKGVVTGDLNQIRTFYTAPETSIFITFHHGALYWCRPKGGVEILADGSRRRGTVDGWSNQTLNGTLLTTDRLSGQLAATQGYRQTICSVKAENYLLAKLGDEVLPEVEVAVAARDALLKALVGLMQLLTWRDFELLVDLVFSSSGWQRTSDNGRAQKTVDFEILLPTTQERAFVQVKAEATAASLADYIDRMRTMPGFSRMFFVWHTGTVAIARPDPQVTLVGPEALAPMVLDTGLTSWLINKTS